MSWWFFHPLSGLGYQFWSGIGSDLSEITLLGMVAGWWFHHNCHERGCWKIGHPDQTGKVVCRRHHSSNG